MSLNIYKEYLKTSINECCMNPNFEPMADKVINGDILGIIVENGDVALCSCGIYVHEDNIERHVSESVRHRMHVFKTHLKLYKQAKKFSKTFRSVREECFICAQEKELFVKCSTCVEMCCSTCINHVDNCPFCRTPKKYTVYTVYNYIDEWINKLNHFADIFVEANDFSPLTI
jgi:hypothetical protein